MKYAIYKRQARTIIPLKTLEDIPNVEKLRYVGQYKHFRGGFIGMQYALYYPTETVIVELPDEESWKAFHKYLGEKFKAAGVKVKVAVGTVQDIEVNENEIDE